MDLGVQRSKGSTKVTVLFNMIEQIIFNQFSHINGVYGGIISSLNIQ